MAIGMKKAQPKEEVEELNDDVSLSFDNADDTSEDVDLSFDDDDDDDSPSDNKKSSINSKYLVIGVIAVVVIVVIAITFIGKFRKQDTQQVPEETQMEEQPSEVTDTGEDNTVTQEEPPELTDEQLDNSDLNVKDISSDFDEENGETSDAPLSSVNDFVKDLDGNDIPSTYHISNRSYTKDYVSYVRRRAVTDDGMELYWLDIVYKDHNYKVQVPFYVFESLEEKGICVCTMEVLTLSNGSKVISYMEVLKDAASRLEQEVN